MDVHSTDVSARETDTGNQLLTLLHCGDLSDQAIVPDDTSTAMRSGNECLGASVARCGVLGDGPVEYRAGQGFEVGRPSERCVRVEPTDAGPVAVFRDPFGNLWDLLQPREVST